MKLSTFIAAAAVAVVCLVQPSAAEAQASLHLRIHTSGEHEKGVCYMQCPTGQHCENGTNYCRKPKSGECFNPATGKYQKGCDPGFKCSSTENKCVYA